MIALIFGIITISMFFIHEMDAIKAKEWKMFIFFKSMKEEIAYRIFAGVHFPLYFIILFLMTQGNEKVKLWIFMILDILLILHTLVHFLFRNNKNNGFLSVYSKIIIYLIGISAIVNLLTLIIFKL